MRLRTRACILHGILYDDHHMPRTTPSRKEVTHERIVEVAARVIRRSGYNGTGVADIMKEAGLTHGGFYAHFESRETSSMPAIASWSRRCAASRCRLAWVIVWR